MNINQVNRTLLAVVVIASLLGFSSTTNAQALSKNQGEQQEDKDKKEAKDKLEQKKVREEKSGQEQPQPVQSEQGARSKQEKDRSGNSLAPRIQSEHQQAAQQTHAAQEQVKQDRLGKENQAKQRQQAAQKTRIAQQAINQQRKENRKPALVQPMQKARQDRRLPPQQQRVLIQQQQQRVTQYRQYASQRQNNSRQIGLQLQQQKRTSQYRYQQQYYERVRLQQLSYQNDRYDYNNDPYFYTASSFRYSRGGSYYETNQYGANILRQALNYGYQEGMRAGRADQQDNWRYSYRDSYIYQDANYGYNGYYVQQEDYNYYFRQGFQRGYEDGFYGRRQYGRNNNGSDSLLGVVLNTILNLQSIR